MRSPFPGFPPDALRFFRALVRNNRRDWFLPRKPFFEERVRQPMRQLVEALNAALRGFAPEYVTDPGEAVYRFYRDTRFSSDKSPYKDHIAATFPRRGLARHQGAGYYFQVSHRGVGIGGGVYLPPPDTLLAIRHRLAEDHARFRRLAAAPALRRLFGELQGERLARVPKGFGSAHPAADLLRFKQFLFYTELPAEVATSPALYAEILKRFRAMAPFMEFLNTPLARSRAKKIGDLLV